MDDTFMPVNSETDEAVIDLGNAADLTLGEGKSVQEDKRKIYN